MLVRGNISIAHEVGELLGVAMHFQSVVPVTNRFLLLQQAASLRSDRLCFSGASEIGPSRRYLSKAVNAIENILSGEVPVSGTPLGLTPRSDLEEGDSLLTEEDLHDASRAVHDLTGIDPSAVGEKLFSSLLQKALRSDRFLKRAVVPLPSLANTEEFSIWDPPSDALVEGLFQGDPSLRLSFVDLREAFFLGGELAVATSQEQTSQWWASGDNSASLTGSFIPIPTPYSVWTSLNPQVTLESLQKKAPEGDPTFGNWYSALAAGLTIGAFFFGQNIGGISPSLRSEMIRAMAYGRDFTLECLVDALPPHLAFSGPEMV